jgi:hypothetical protein
MMQQKNVQIKNQPFNDRAPQVKQNFSKWPDFGASSINIMFFAILAGFPDFFGIFGFKN